MSQYFSLYILPGGSFESIGYGVGWENRVGSIKAGKVADFAVLEEDPFTVDPMQIKDIEVWDVIYEGETFPAN